MYNWLFTMLSEIKEEGRASGTEKRKASSVTYVAEQRKSWQKYYCRKANVQHARQSLCCND